MKYILKKIYRYPIDSFLRRPPLFNQSSFFLYFIRCGPDQHSGRQDTERSWSGLGWFKTNLPELMNNGWSGHEHFHCGSSLKAQVFFSYINGRHKYLNQTISLSFIRVHSLSVIKDFSRVNQLEGFTYWFSVVFRHLYIGKEHKEKEIIRNIRRHGQQRKHCHAPRCWW